MSLSVYSSAQMQEWDQFTIKHEPIDSVDLMERAASIATKHILGRNVFDTANIYCGPGNNGGDGLVIARLLHEAGKSVTVYLLDFGNQSEDFKKNFEKLDKKIEVIPLNDQNPLIERKADLHVDAVFGSGLDRSISGWIAQVIIGMNEQAGIKIAIDMPSGLFSVDNLENESFPAVFEAHETLTFMSPKMPFFFPTYVGFVGNFRILNIDLHSEFKADSIAEFILREDISIQKRSKFSHKGTHGALTVIGGLSGMSGAAIISCTAAMKSGAGYVFCVSDQMTRAAIYSQIPEVICQEADDMVLNSKSTAIAIGPGLGTESRSKDLLEKAFNSDLPLVIDADAINLLSEQNLLTSLPQNAILTPHLGELKRLVGIHKTDEEMLKAQIEFSKQHSVYVIQKGPFSKLTTPDGNVYINSTGNPGMATAGMGDALTGIIGSFLAQGYSPLTSAINGMYLHGYAADTYAKNYGEIGLMATDVANLMPKVINQFVRI